MRYHLKARIPSFPSCTWERKCPRNFVASAGGKHSFADKCVPKYNLGTRNENQP
jgi:hypothetical protein